MREAVVLAPDVPHARIRPDESCDLISRIVVGQDDLDVGFPSMPLKTFEARGYPRSRVEGNDDDREIDDA
jgi:hypothetical protein